MSTEAPNMYSISELYKLVKEKYSKLRCLLFIVSFVVIMFVSLGEAAEIWSLKTQLAKQSVILTSINYRLQDLQENAVIYIPGNIGKKMWGDREVNIWKEDK